jgi:hypothetical protein
MAGIPVTAGAVTKGYYDRSYVDVETDDGVKVKLFPANLSLSGSYSFGVFAVEGGYEYHHGYKNKECTLTGTVIYGGGYEQPFEEYLEEDYTKHRMQIFTIGGRYALPFLPRIKPYVDGGLLYCLSHVDLIDNGVTDENHYYEGNNIGLYFGGCANVFLTPKFALTFPVKARYFFAGDYTYFEYGAKDENYGYRPPLLLTVGAGAEFFPF